MVTVPTIIVSEGVTRIVLVEVTTVVVKTVEPPDGMQSTEMIATSQTRFMFMGNRR